MINYVDTKILRSLPGLKTLIVDILPKHTPELDTITVTGTDRLKQPKNAKVNCKVFVSYCMIELASTSQIGIVSMIGLR